MHFSRLQVTGFKSFVDTTELFIEPGMTGVVGPNGCGKSNVVEALRWVMGETSPKSMRGGEMEDVIFGGTTTRPSRNIAEVLLKLDNADRSAPAAFNDSEEIEVSRKIERGAGSQYRINGKEVRAWDVQLLFADLASGAHSTAMVSQGRIGALIGAKPTERRVLLEEAAGIRGLHSRRHEAELRLRAAETNLSRLDDVIEALEGQHHALQRQARQAKRYRRLSESIRRYDAILLHLRWRQSTAALDAARARLQVAETDVAARTEAAGTAAAQQANAAALLPDMRQKETEAAAELQRLLMARNELEREEARIADAKAEAERRLNQISDDIEREQSLAAEANTAIERLVAEATTIDTALANEATRAETARAALDEITAHIDAKDAERNELLSATAETEAKRATLERQRDQLWERIEKLKHRANEMDDERVGLAAEVADDSALVEIQSSIDAAEKTVTTARDEAAEAEAALKSAQESETAAREQAREMEATRERLSAEIRALAELVDPAEGDFFAPLIEAIAVDPGSEVALGVALGDDIEAPVDTAAPVYWAVLPALPVLQSLPDRVTPLAKFVKAPPALQRRLSQIGVVEDDKTGENLHAALKPGQRIVSKKGALWRWDGYRVSAGAPTPAATRLGQRNRLIALREQLHMMDPDFKATQLALESARREREAAETVERTARHAQNDAFSALNTAREAFGGRLQRRRSREIAPLRPRRCGKPGGFRSQRGRAAMESHAARHRRTGRPGHKTRCDRMFAGNFGRIAHRPIRKTQRLRPLETRISRTRGTAPSRNGRRRDMAQPAERCSRPALQPGGTTHYSNRCTSKPGGASCRNRRATEQSAQRDLRRRGETRRGRGCARTGRNDAEGGRHGPAPCGRTAC